MPFEDVVTAKHEGLNKLNTVVIGQSLNRDIKFAKVC